VQNCGYRATINVRLNRAVDYITPRRSTGARPETRAALSWVLNVFHAASQSTAVFAPPPTSGLPTIQELSVIRGLLGGHHPVEPACREGAAA
jgi:hypothetical protein